MKFRSYSSHLMLLTISIVWTTINNSFTATSSTSTTAPDHIALLAFKDKINGGALSSWNDSIHYCQWNGITCSLHHRDRVMVLDLESEKLEGTLSPHIGNLSFLRELWLGGNNFHGPIPQEVGRLSRLRIISLANNSFNGEIPTNLTHCSKLQVIDLTYNYLSGGIPIELTSLSKLTTLYLQSNKIQGSIPSLLGNMSMLNDLIIKTNRLTGRIPEDLCHMQRLERFNAGENNLSGKVRLCLFSNLSHITRFSLTSNQLEGSLPSEIGLRLPNLQMFLIGDNKLNGLLPLSFPNASRLEVIELGGNQFTGQVPRDLGKLPALRYLSLHSNQLGSPSGDDLRFITSLTNCTNLQVLTVTNNSLKGSLPDSIANLSTQLTALSLGQNKIYGSTPVGITNLVNLTKLHLAENHLTGKISGVIGVFPKMNTLYLEGNEFSGQIPDTFKYNSTLLTVIFLSRNKLHGEIPPSLASCPSLLALVLNDNRLSGTIPKQIFGLPSLRGALDLSYNAFSGPLPSEVGNLSNLVELYLSGNRFSGHLPSMLGNILPLEHLSIDRNLFTGNIPQSLRALEGIKKLDLSHNKLSGEIPPYLGNFTSLTQLDLSYNDLEGPVPKVGIFENANKILVAGNSKLCGGVAELKLPPCHTHKKGKSHFLKVIFPVIGVSVCLILVCSFFIWYQRSISKAKPSSSPSFNNQFPRISYAELLRATNSFSANNLIGIGSYGFVYKGVLAQVNTTVAIKVVNLQQRGGFRSFLSECNALRNVRHRNLLKIITTCSSVDFQGNDFKALVFEFMPNGSLEDWLHSDRNEQDELKNLNFLQRLNIAIDIASALDYLHNHCQPAIVHCDLKPSNILLDEDLSARVADFGLAKIFSITSYSQSQSNSLAVKGAIGYVAPEYGMGDAISMRGDVYSYGIVLLEMFSGKKPTDGIFQDRQNLHHFAKMALREEEVMNIMDPTMFLESTSEDFNIANQSQQETRVQECLVSVIRLGVACSAESPTERMKIGEVLTELYHIREHYQGVRIHQE